MFFTGKHVCKSPVPFDATTFDLRTLVPRQTFSGTLSISIRAEQTKQRSGDNGATVKYQDIKQTRVRITVVIDQSLQPNVKTDSEDMQVMYSKLT